ncbi:MAG TPA: hypothetical protein VFR86_13910 [Burkholderiaceae bacterium]|nr:hypothetical protein [Burkholderiaceae bacterium]
MSSFACRGVRAADTGLLCGGSTMAAVCPIGFDIEGLKNEVRRTGALQSAELVQVITEAGFRDVALRDRFDSFLGTNKEATARKFGVMGVNVSAYR